MGTTQEKEPRLRFALVPCSMKLFAVTAAYAALLILSPTKAAVSDAADSDSPTHAAEQVGASLCASRRAAN